MSDQVPEHTWGADIKTYLPDIMNWDNADFHAHLADPDFQTVVAGWYDQAAYLDHALQALGNSPEVGRNVGGCAYCFARVMCLYLQQRVCLILGQNLPETHQSLRVVRRTMQGQHMRSNLRQLEGLWQQPSVADFRRLSTSDALTFTSHAWTLSIDPATGMSLRLLLLMCSPHIASLCQLH